MQGNKEKVTAASLLIALGIIYGDIGTSPLYVLKAIAGERELSELLVYGGISCVFWTITFQTTFKYIYLTLKADNHGEGGIFSLYTLVRRYGKYLAIPTILGACTLLADGIITPPISISAAVEGLVHIPGLEEVPTVPIVLLIISFLFFMQRFGTHRIGALFGQGMTIWFIMLATLGLVNITRHPEILKALNPAYAIDFIREYPKGFSLLGSVFLATTGAEALYSDLGYCGKKNIRITWGFVKISLILNYLGQASWLMSLEPGSVLQGRNPFFESMPSWFQIPGIIVATSAAIIASQALISGSYTLINEAMNLNFWPRMKVRQPSDVKGQIYIPGVNTMLWAGCIFVVLHFKDSAHMYAAYGLAIALTMMATTFLLCFFLIYRLKWNKYVVGAIVLIFTTIEVSFFMASIKKFTEGGYITIIISAVYAFIMYTVYKGRKITNKFIRFVDLEHYENGIKELSEDLEIEKFSTHLIYLSKANNKYDIEEKIVNSIFAKKPKRADVYWFVHLHRTTEPYTLSYDVSELIDDKLIKVNINVGFRIQPRTELYFKKIVQDLIKNKELNLHNRPDGSTKYNSEPDFKFVVVEKFLSVENEFTLGNGILINFYFFLKNIGLSDEKAFGLEKSDVVTEYVPLVLKSAPDNLLHMNKHLHLYNEKNDKQ